MCVGSRTISRISIQLFCSSHSAMALARALICAAALLAGLVTHIGNAHREHKIHNIVLYPDKNSWCNTTPIKQVVAYPGCNSVEIDNNVCVGACYSYSIPLTTLSSPGELIKPYCDSCQPSEVTWQDVSLDCNGEEMQEKVQMLENCSCSTCHIDHDNGGSQLPTSSVDEISHQPSLLANDLVMESIVHQMDFMNSHSPRKHSNESSNHTTITSDPVLNEKLLLLLKQFNENDSFDDSPDFDKTALQELLKQVKGVDHRVNKITLGKIVKHVEDTEHIKVNIMSLQLILARLAREQMESDRSEQTHHEPHRHHLHSHHHGGHDHHVSLEGRHPHHELSDKPPLHHESHTAKHHHPLEDDGVDDEELDPTLDVASHHLKPALAGTVLSYHENVVHSEDEDSDTSRDSFS